MTNPAQRGSFWRAGGGAFVIAAALSGGCSVLFHVDASQCTTTADCTARGAAFTGFTCSAGTCIRPQCVHDSDCASADAALAGYTCSQFACVPPVMTMKDAGGTDAPAEAGGCKTNADCQGSFIVNPMYSQVACNVDTHTCLQLDSKDCPVIIGDFSGKTAPPYFLGAFMVYPTMGGFTTHPTYLNYALALGEFNTNLGGIQVGLDGTARMPCAVACDVAGDLNAAMTHLINDVGATSVVSALPTTQLSSIFQTSQTTAAQNNSSVLFVNALAADSNLLALTTKGLLWSMLGQPGDAAPAYMAFLPIVENYVRNNPPWNLGPTAPLKVATVTGNSAATNGLAAAVKAVLTWNGGLTTTQNQTNGNYLDVIIPESTLNGTSLTDPQLTADVMRAEQTILAFKPSVIISFGSDEFVKLVENLEIDWTSPPSLPFYLVGPYNMGSQLLQVDVKTFPGSAYKRFAGIGVASAPLAYQSVLATYETTFLDTYQRPDALGEENYYDAMYFAVYSRLAAGRIPAQGSDLANGMKKLISLTDTAYDMGPADMGHISAALAQRSSIELIGTLGPPDFDTATGARVGAGDVYCFLPDVDAGGYDYDYDVLRLINADGTPPDAGVSPFQGSFPCYSGIQ